MRLFRKLFNTWTIGVFIVALPFVLFVDLLLAPKPVVCACAKGQP